MRDRLLVVTTVHHPDDNRIREKTVRSLESEFDVTYAARQPGPSDRSGLRWQPLPGSRVNRNLAAWRVAWSGRFDVVSIHDPELLPLGLLLAWTNRSAVVFDVHEDIPAQILTKDWIPAPLRKPISFVLQVLLRLAERSMTLTLAEDSYGRIFRQDHPVLANFPETSDLPRSAGGVGVVYVGDVTEARGLIDAVIACGKVGMPFTVVGPFRREVEVLMEREAERYDTDLTMTDRLPHDEAMQAVAGAAVAISPLRDIPNYRHSIPTKVLEYLAVGVPVAASDLPATRSLVEGLAAVELHTPGDPDALAAALERLMADDAGVAARAQADVVRNRFRWPAAEVRSVYRSAR